MAIGYNGFKSESEHITVTTFKQEGSTKNVSMALTDFIDQLNSPGASSFSALTSSSFPSLTDCIANTTSEALKWTTLEQNTVYQIVSTHTVNTQYGQSVVLSLQKADGSNCSVWACGMLMKELLQNPMMMVSSQLFVLSTGPKISKIGRVYNSYQLLQC